MFNKDAIDHIDLAISEAKKFGLRLIIPLTDNWNYYHGGKTDFVKWNGISGPTNTSCYMPDANFPDAGSNCAFYFDRGVINAFKNYLAMLLNHR